MHKPTTAAGAPMLDTSRLALIYPRQSTAHQVEQNVYSLDNQLKLKDRAIADGFDGDRIVVIDDDLGVSARTITKRVGMQRALTMINQGLVGALYAEDQTRLSRDVDTVDHMEIGKRCRLARVPMFYGGSWRDLTDRNDRLVYKVEAVIGSEMWATHVEKMYRAQLSKAEKGQASTKLPRGYRPKRDVPKNHPDRDKPVIFEPEAEVIRAFVARVLDAGAVRSAFTSWGPVYWPEGRRVTLYTIQRCLSLPVYRGHYAWGEALVPDSHPAIITPKQAGELDRLRELNRNTKRKESPTGNVLAGLVWCPTCKRKITSAKAARSSYRCSSSEHDRKRSIHFHLDGAGLDRAVMADLWARLDAGLVEGILVHLVETERTRAQVVDMSEASRRVLQRKVDGLTRAMADPTLVPAALRVLVQQLNQATEELEAVGAAAKTSPTIAEDLAFYEGLRDDREWLALLPGTWEDEPLQWRRSWLRRFIANVEVSREPGGMHRVAIAYRDGTSVLIEHRSKSTLSEEERVLVERLIASPEFPGHGRGAMPWLVAQLAAHGFHRNRGTLRRFFPGGQAGRAAQEE